MGVTYVDSRFHTNMYMYRRLGYSLVYTVDFRLQSIQFLFKNTGESLIRHSHTILRKTLFIYFV